MATGLTTNDLYNATIVNRWYGNVGRGRVNYVDPVLGDDTKAAVNQSPFATLTAANNNASGIATAANPVTVKLAPGTYTLDPAASLGMTVVAGVSIVGSGPSQTFIVHNMTSGGTSIQLNSGASIANLSVTTSTATGNGTVVAVLAISDSTNRIAVDTVMVAVNQPATASSASTLGAVWTYMNAQSDSITIRNVKGVATNLSTAVSNSYGLVIRAYNNITASTTTVRSSSFTGTSVPAGVSAGVWANPGAGPVLYDSVFSGTNYDIYNTVSGGVMNTVKSSVFVNYSPFNAMIQSATEPQKIFFGASGTLGSGAAVFAAPGFGAANANALYAVAVGYGCLAIGLTICARVAPGGTATLTATLCKNGALTTLVATLSGANLTANSWSTANAASCAFNYAPGDRISLVLSNGTGSVAADVSVAVSII